MGSGQQAGRRVASSLTFIGFAILGFARTGSWGIRTLMHLLLAAANLGLIAVLVSFGFDLGVTVIGTAGILAIDVVATVRSKRSLVGKPLKGRPDHVHGKPSAAAREGEN